MTSLSTRPLERNIDSDQIISRSGSLHGRFRRVSLRLSSIAQNAGRGRRGLSKQCCLFKATGPFSVAQPATVAPASIDASFGGRVFRTRAYSGHQGGPAFRGRDGPMGFRRMPSGRNLRLRGHVRVLSLPFLPFGQRSLSARNTHSLAPQRTGAKGGQQALPDGPCPSAVPTVPSVGPAVASRSWRRSGRGAGRPVLTIMRPRRRVDHHVSTHGRLRVSRRSGGGQEARPRRIQWRVSIGSITWSISRTEAMLVALPVS